MPTILAELSRYPVATPLRLTGTSIVARDIAHARIKERLDRGEGMPAYLKHHPVYYAGPAKTPAGLPSGSFGPTTAGRMDSYVDLFQSHGGSMIMIAKGNRSKAVTDACKKHGGFYLGSIGGPAALAGEREHQEGRAARVPRAGHGGRLQDRGRGFPGIHPGRRQGERVLRPASRALVRRLIPPGPIRPTTSAAGSRSPDCVPGAMFSLPR